MLSCKIAVKKLGLCNELFHFYQSIIEAIDDEYNVLVIGRFMPDRYNDKLISFSDIIDIDALNDNLLRKHNIKLYTCPFSFQILKITYGYHDYTIDITDLFMSNFMDKNNNIFMNKNINLNSLVNDPCSGIPKKLKIYYQINNDSYCKIYHENGGYLNQDVKFVVNENFFELPLFTRLGGGIFHKVHREMYNYIIPKIKFKEIFYDNYNTYKTILENKCVNVLHLKFDKITFDHYNSIYGRYDDWFKNTLRDKYIDIIHKYLNPAETTFVLAYNFENEIIKFMIDNRYNILYANKNNLGEEMNALNDMITADICNNIFIGPCNLEGFNGSSFSLNICCRLNNVKRILFDPDNINIDPIIYEKN